MAGMQKGILLYTSYWGHSGAKYYNPTDEELQKLLSASNEILLIPIATFNRYRDENGNEKQVLDEHTLDSLTPDMVADPNMLEAIKSEYAPRIETYLRANFHMDDYVEDAVAYARRLVKLDPTVKLWFSAPLEGCLHALTHLFADAWVYGIHRVKEVLESEIWENNVQGIYVSLEDIVTAYYTKFDPSCPEEDFHSPMVYSMRRVSNVAHSYGKECLWIPYYHGAACSHTTLGHVANRTNIFDTVIIQPSYFFRAERTPELGIVAECVRQQQVIDTDGSVIGGEKTSGTVIGFEMEIDHQFFDKEDYKERYYGYEKAFGEFVGKYPTAYYAGCPDTAVKVADLMKKFLQQ